MVLNFDPYPIWWSFIRSEGRGGRGLVSVCSDEDERVPITHKGTNSCYELRLHCLFFSESTPNQDRVIRDLVRNLVCEAGERGGSSDQRTRVEGSRHASMNGESI